MEEKMKEMQIEPRKVETWARVKGRNCSARVMKGVDRVINTKPAFDLERAYADMKAYEEYKDQPRVIQRARALETFLRDKTIRIEPDELIVGNVADKVKGAPFFGEYYYQFTVDEMDDPVKDFENRGFDEFVITSQQRKELRKTILPFFKDKCLQRHVFDDLMDKETRDKTCALEGAYPTTPVIGGLMVQTDCGHTVVNYPKILKHGLEAIKEDVIYHKKQAAESYCFGRVDQYLYPYYVKSVHEDKELTKDKAVELLQMWFIKTNEHAEIYNYDNAQTQMGYQLGIQMTLGGQTRNGKDAVNELSYVLMDAEEELGLQNPDFGIRVFDGSDRNFIKRVAQVIRLGRGKPKYFYDNKALECLQKEYPDLPIEDLREYITVGCTELILLFSSQPNTFVALVSVPKVLELTLHNGKCALTGERLGPETGDPCGLASMDEVKAAFEAQFRHWIEFGCKSVKIQLDAQAEFSYSPLNSALMEGPIQKGKDLCEGGAWYTAYTLWFPGIATAADALTSIDTLIFNEKKVSWEELIKALDAD